MLLELSVISTIMVMLVIHYVADFWLQSEWMALNKSKSIPPLAIHCVLYAVPFLVFGWVFAIITGVLHFMTDYVSSRWASHYHSIGEDRKFFQVIGLDQLIHMVCIFGLASILGII